MSQTSSAPSTPNTDIAVIGMAGRFPGARDLAQYWENLRGGVESVKFFTEEELLAAGESPDLLHQPNYVRACPVLAGIDQFDASFFGFSPRDAAIMDPQHRFFLETAWEALENAGYNPETHGDSIGVFAGSGMNLYMMYHLVSNPDLMESIGEFLVRHTGNDKDFLATRASYEMNLKGPSVNIQTACSSALVSIHFALQSLLNGECDMALAGAATILIPQRGYLCKEGEILSPDGHCRAFDAESKGTIFGSGVGLVVLKRLADAQADGDNILAVIKGSAINNDGSMKVGYLAPSVEGQAKAITEALALSGVPPETISYVEAHGTGTLVGDPIEVTAITQAYRGFTQEKNFCALGSVKTNIGHLGEAAGIAGFIKTVLALQHREIPPSLNFRAPNAQIDFPNSPFYVNTRLTEWKPRGGVRRAGITALGAGGTNAHAILEEAPPRELASESRPWQLLLLSAKTPSALDAATSRLAGHLKANSALDLTDVAYTLAVGRKSFAHRRLLVCRDFADAIATLESKDTKRVFTQAQPKVAPSVVFLFPGGGAQYATMGRELYDTEPVYHDAIEECLNFINPQLGRDLRTLLFPEAAEARAASTVGLRCSEALTSAPTSEAMSPPLGTGGPELRSARPGQSQGVAAATPYQASAEVEAATRKLEQPSLALPALFATEYALAKLLQSWGVKPAAMMGHSMGEYVAACLAGVFSVQDGLALVALRGRLFETLPEGGMLSVPLPEAEARAFMGPELSFAAINGPSLCVASGPVGAIAAMETALRAKDIDCTRIHINVAAHSSMLEPILAEFEKFCRRIAFQTPTQPFISNLTGTWITAEQATDPVYWVKHLRHTVRFADGLAELLKEPGRVLVEIGPGRTLSSLAKQQPAKALAALSTLRHPKEAASDVAFLLTTFGQLWLNGVKLDWASFYAEERRHRVPLPTYPFERQRFWVEPGKAVSKKRSATLRKRTDIAEWFYLPSWKRALALPVPEKISGNWLVFLDDTGLGQNFVRQLTGASVVTVSAGKKFSERERGAFTVNPASRGDFDALVETLQTRQQLPDHVVHFWGVTASESSRPALDSLGVSLAQNFHSLFYLAQALASEERPMRWTAVSNGLHALAGEVASQPEKALALGPVRVIPREFPHIITRSVDLSWPQTGGARPEFVCAQLLAECVAPAGDGIVALRGPERWVQTIEPAPLAAAPAAKPWLRAGGVYLVTGGLGGIGFEVARHLARSCQAKLVLLGRTLLPPKSEWAARVAVAGEGDTVTRALRKLQELESLGAQVLPISADVTNLPQMRDAVAETRRHFGVLHGVIHAAGVLDDGLISVKTDESAARVLLPKVKGALVLDAALQGTRLDFFALFSSVSSLLGLPGQIDYTAANAFLDAFARQRAWREGDRTISINWGAWKGVGMVNAIAAQAEKKESATKAALLRKAKHPCWDVWYEGKNHERVFKAELSRLKQWLLAEHVVKGGDALIPGTGFLELVRGAWTELPEAAGGTVEICDVVFLSPFVVKADETRELRLTFKLRGAEAEFAFSSNGGAETHVTGKVRRIEAVAERRHDLDAARAGCGVRAETLNGFLNQVFMDFGPRWGCLRRIDYGEREALVSLELPAMFASDLIEFQLHPALLDMATGGAQPLIPNFDRTRDFYVPFSYGRVVLRAPLPAKLFSLVRCRDGHAKDLAVFDITLMDERGREVGEIQNFVMTRVANSRALHATSRPVTTHSAAHDEPAHESAATKLLNTVLREGILASEGLEAFDRILAQPALSQIAAVAVDLPTWREQIEAITRPPETATTGDAAAGPKFSRPNLQSEFAGPTNDEEKFLVQLWRELLGVEQVGVRDNFFELGGHSLIAVRLFNRIKKQYKVDLGLSVLFEAPTVEQIAALIRTELKLLAPTKTENDAAAALRVAPASTEHPEGSGSVAAGTPLRRRGPCIVPLRPEGSGPPLYCLHGMGGNPIEYLALVKYLHPGRPVYGIQAQGLDGKREIQTQVEEIATNYAQQIAEFQPEGPYYFVGGSFGGMVAYEIAQQFHRQGRTVRFLGMFDTFGKDYPKYLPSTTRLHRWVFREWQRWRHHWKSVAMLSGAERRVYIRDRALKARKQTVKHTRRFFQRARRRIELLRLPKSLRMQARLTGEDVAAMKGVEVPKAFQDVAIATNNAARKYDPQPYDGHVILFRAEFQPLGIYEDKTNGWGPFVKDLEVINIPAYHGMMREPFVRMLAQQVNDALARVEGTTVIVPSPTPSPQRNGPTSLAKSAAVL